MTTATAHDIATAISRAPLSFEDLSLLISMIENRLVQIGGEEVATEDASVRLCQAIDEIGQLREVSAEERKVQALSYYSEMAREARRAA